MKKAILMAIVLLMGTISFAQKENKKAAVDSTVQAATLPAVLVTDSTALISYQDINVVLKYMGDKLLAKDFFVLQDALKKVLDAKAEQINAALINSRKQPPGTGKK